MNQATLILADGTIFQGEAFGKKGIATGEICFNTGMTGYQEVFTDPSYFGQVLIMNTAHVGNYGAKNSDIESDSVKINGLICKTLSDNFSRDMADESLEQYLLDNNVVAIHKVDTRALVAHVRENGAMNCIISTDTQDIEELKKQLAEVPSMDGLELASKVSTSKAYTSGEEGAKVRIAALDLGIKRSIVKNMVDRGAYVKVFPAKTDFATLEEFNPNAFFISNGPGDPAPMNYAVDTVKKILESGKPTFGICLGHQILSMACGASTYKMHHGHRGLNHPVKNLIKGTSEISTQNHGFAVDADSIKASDQLEISHINLNDDTIEGVRVKGKKAFSVQYHPEATPGPHDSRYLFDEFMEMIQN